MKTRKPLTLGEKIALWGSISFVAAILLAALGYAGFQNLVNYYTQKAAEEEARSAEIKKKNEENTKKWEAYWKTPEGQAEKAKQEREAAALAAVVWHRWNKVANAFKEVGFVVVPSNEPKHISILVPYEKAVRLTNYEIKAFCQMAYNNLGDGSVVEMTDAGGVLLGKADGWSVKAYK